MTILRQDIELVRGKHGAFKVDISDYNDDIHDTDDYTVTATMYDQTLAPFHDGDGFVDVQGSTSNLASGVINLSFNAWDTMRMSQIARYEVLVTDNTGDEPVAILTLRGKVFCPKRMHVSTLNADNIIYVNGDDVATGIDSFGDTSELSADD